jgi:hypothetical protein
MAVLKAPPTVATGNSLFYMLLSIDNTHLCCAAVSPRFLLYVHAHYDSLCHSTYFIIVATITGTTAYAVAQLWPMAICQLKSSLGLAQTLQRVYLQHLLGAVDYQLTTSFQNSMYVRNTALLRTPRCNIRTAFAIQQLYYISYI